MRSGCSPCRRGSGPAAWRAPSPARRCTSGSTRTRSGLRRPCPLARLLAIGLGAAATRGGTDSKAAGDERQAPARGAAAMVFAQAVLEMGRLIERLGGRSTTAAGPAALGHLATLMQGGAEHALGRRLALRPAAPDDPGNAGEPDSGREIALAIGTTVVGWCATGRIDREAIPLTRALLDALIHDQPLVLPWTRFHRSPEPPEDRRLVRGAP